MYDGQKRRISYFIAGNSRKGRGARVILSISYVVGEREGQAAAGQPGSFAATLWF